MSKLQLPRTKMRTRENSLLIRFLREREISEIQILRIFMMNLNGCLQTIIVEGQAEERVRKNKRNKLKPQAMT